MRFVRIEPGTFTMGSPATEEERDFDGRHDEAPHAVTITRPYYIGVTEVSQAQWRAVMGTSPSSFQGDDLPVEQVGPFEEFLYPHLERKHAKLMPDIANKKELTDELRDALTAAINEAKAEFIAARGIKAA